MDSAYQIPDTGTLMSYQKYLQQYEQDYTGTVAINDLWNAKGSTRCVCHEETVPYLIYHKHENEHIPLAQMLSIPTLEEE